MKKQDLKPYNNKGQQHGFRIAYVYDGNLYYKGQYLNDIEHGYWIGNWKRQKPNITFHIK